MALWKRIRALLAGSRLAHAVDRNNRAAAELDLLVREVLNQ